MPLRRKSSTKTAGGDCHVPPIFVRYHSNNRCLSCIQRAIRVHSTVHVCISKHLALETFHILTMQTAPTCEEGAPGQVCAACQVYVQCSTAPTSRACTGGKGACDTYDTCDTPKYTIVDGFTALRNRCSNCASVKLKDPQARDHTSETSKHRRGTCDGGQIVVQQAILMALVQGLLQKPPGRLSRLVAQPIERMMTSVMTSVTMT